MNATQKWERNAEAGSVVGYSEPWGYWWIAGDNGRRSFNVVETGWWVSSRETVVQIKGSVKLGLPKLKSWARAKDKKWARPVWWRLAQSRWVWGPSQAQVLAIGPTHVSHRTISSRTNLGIRSPKWHSLTNLWHYKNITDSEIMKEFKL